MGWIQRSGKTLCLPKGAGAWNALEQVSTAARRSAELLDLTDHIREMIVGRRPTSEIKRAAIGEGMITLRESGLSKIRARITTLREINKVRFVD